MPESDSDNRERSPAGMIAATVVLLIPVAYVLSTGPVQWLAVRGYLSNDAARFVEWFYSPLGYLARIDAAQKGLEWWLSLWK